MVLRFYTSGLAYSQFDSNVRILGCLIIPAYKANSVIRNSQLEQVQAFSGKLIEFLGEQAEKEVPLDAIAVALLARAGFCPLHLWQGKCGTPYPPHLERYAGKL